MLRDPQSLLYLAVGAVAALGLAFVLFGVRRWKDPRARGRAALVVAVALGGAFALERRLVGASEREGGLLLVYASDMESALAGARDRWLDEFREAAAVSLGIHAGEGRATLEELRKLRSELRIDRAPGRAEEIIVTLAPSADRATLDTALSRVPQGLGAKREPGGRRVTMMLSLGVVDAYEERLDQEVVATLRRRLEGLRVAGTVQRREGKVAVVLPPMDARAVHEIREILEQPAKLAFAMVDDDEDFFADLSHRPEAQLPRGVLFVEENAPTGLSPDGSRRSKAVHYARLARGEGEDMAAARRRFEAWLATLPVDSDHALSVGKVQELNDETGALEDVGWRTYYRWDRTEISGEDVRDARASASTGDRGPATSWIVSLSFSPRGAERFEQVTAENVRRRFAILLDGMVESAPVILSRIPGGQATITMGAGDPEHQSADAKRLELVLLSGALPASVKAQSEARLPPNARWIAIDRGLLGAAVAMAIALVVIAIRGFAVRAEPAS